MRPLIVYASRTKLTVDGAAVVIQKHVFVLLASSFASDENFPDYLQVDGVGQDVSVFRPKRLIARVVRIAARALKRIESAIQSFAESAKQGEYWLPWSRQDTNSNRVYGRGER